MYVKTTGVPGTQIIYGDTMQYASNLQDKDGLERSFMSCRSLPPYYTRVDAQHT